MGIGRFSMMSAVVFVGSLVGCGMTTGPGPSSSGVPSARRFHFAVASAGHFGEPGTDDRANYADLVSALSDADAADPLAVVVLDGDLSHGGLFRANGACAALAELSPRYLVIQGNHDELTEAEWRQMWGAPGNQVVRFGDSSLILANTSNAGCDYVCPNEEWFSGALAETAAQRNVLAWCGSPEVRVVSHRVRWRTTLGFHRFRFN